MAGGRFQDIASVVIAKIEAHVQLDTSVASAATPPSATPARPIPDNIACTDTSPVTASAKKTGNHPLEPPAKRTFLNNTVLDRSDVGIRRRVRRIRTPPLDVFEREYMEKATPVILTGVSQRQ